MSIKDFADNKPMSLYEDAIGEKSQNYYSEKFESFDQKGDGWHASWNWAALFFTGFWALYRKMYGWFFAWWMFGTVGAMLMKVPSPQIQQWVGLAYIACFLGFSIYANSIYHHKVNKRIAAAQRKSSDASRVSRRLSAGGGVHVWVPIVFGAIPVIGIVVAVVLPAYQDYAKPKVAAVNPYQETQKEVDWSQFEIVSFENGVSASKRGDYSTAFKIFHSLAATQGDVRAQNNLGTIYEKGKGVAEDYAEAAKWYLLAANQGDATAQFNLGTMYSTGKGVIKDYAEALKLYRLSAEQGHSGSQSNLGAMYANGEGVPRDYVRAHMWFNLGSISGNTNAIQNRDTAENQMTPQQIAQAQQMARYCQQRNFKGCD